MTTVLKDHMVFIKDYALELRRELSDRREAGTLSEWVDEQLSLTVWTNTQGWKAEILLTYGGATVSIDLDSRWESTSQLNHSWGAGDDGEPVGSIDFYCTELHRVVAQIVEEGCDQW